MKIFLGYLIGARGAQELGVGDWPTALAK